MKVSASSQTLAGALLQLALVPSVVAQSACKLSSTPSASVATPSVAPNYDLTLVASGLKSPRGITFDKAGHLLVVQQTTNLIALTLEDHGGSCVGVASQKTVVDDSTLNHGITLSFDDSMLYASSPEAVYMWAYDAKTASSTSDPQTLVANMTTSDHTTRTLLLSHKKNGTLVVTRGSTANIDPLTEMKSSGHSQIKAFDLLTRNGRTYDFDTEGTLLGWGMRNDVGIDEHPIDGGLYSVENSVDQLVRQGVDIHESNPGEKLNFLGYLNGTKTKNMGGNFGYPFCYAAWNASNVPGAKGLEVGMQFAMGTPNSTVNDDMCQNERIAPRLVFEAHMAPLDFLFNSAGTEGWVTFHGSWDRTDPSGYKVAAVPFANGEPVAPSTSTSGYIDIVSNKDNSVCPDKCFRPVGLAWDSKGRLFFSSDATGEIYMITRKSGGSMQSASPSVTTATSTSPGSSSSTPASTSTGVGSSQTTGASTKNSQPVGAMSLLAVLMAAILA